MKTKIAKLAAAAVIVLAVVLSVSILNDSTSRAWAIEDSAEALDQFNAIYISGVIAIPLEEMGGGSDLVLREGKKMSIESWAQANEQRTMSGKGL